MFQLSPTPKALAILSMIAFGIASQKEATAARPDLKNLYFAEQERSHCDHLVVAVLEGAPPYAKSKEGHVVSMFPPGKDGRRTDEGVGNGTRSVKRPKATKADVVPCEQCGASCTEPCRCNASGIGLIFGTSDDQPGMMEHQEGYSYFTYQTSYGMRAVTFISMGDDSKQVLAIAKGWKQSTDNPQGRDPNSSVSLDLNPYAEVGDVHNRTLDYLTPDLNLTLMTLRQGNDKVVRKRPGRRSYGDITLKRSSQATPSDEVIYINSCLFMAQVYGISADQFLLPDDSLIDGERIAEDGYRYFQNVRKQASTTASVARAFQRLEETLLWSPSLDALNRSLEHQVIETLESRQLNDDERSLILGSLALAKGTVAYWNAQDDIFDGDIIERGNGRFWADVGGFVAGFTGALVYNNNNGGGSDVNPFTAGTSVGAFASSLCKKKEETGN